MYETKKILISSLAKPSQNLYIYNAKEIISNLIF
ncbi:hypothetical protein BC952_2565 [Flavobacterium limicola]|uniref:Uncharacterized protein n=1 Tax=Flavobacterium limicola TaxID=180441 RepID=A0A495RYL7_9FLAO|nr:hypothetical protein BC952_2565 [Flavobacterium limicola]